LNFEQLNLVRIQNNNAAAITQHSHILDQTQEDSTEWDTATRSKIQAKLKASCWAKAIHDFRNKFYLSLRRKTFANIPLNNFSMIIFWPKGTCDIENFWIVGLFAQKNFELFLCQNACYVFLVEKNLIGKQIFNYPSFIWLFLIWGGFNTNFKSTLYAPWGRFKLSLLNNQLICLQSNIKTVPVNLSVKTKATLIGAVFLIVIII
jgi:hypothetical protein